MVLTRVFLLDRIFTRNELSSLDDELPNIKKLLKPAKPTQLDLRKMSRLRKSRMKKRRGNGKEESDKWISNEANGSPKERGVKTDPEVEY
jgi:hypothetical protein